MGVRGKRNSRESTRDNLLESRHWPLIEGQSQPKVSSQENTSSFYPSLQVPAWTQHLPNPTGNQKVRKPSDIVVKGQPPRTGEWLEKDRKGIWRSKRQLSSACGGFPWSTEQLSNRRNKNTGFLTLILKPFPCMPLCVLVGVCVFTQAHTHEWVYKCAPWRQKVHHSTDLSGTSDWLAQNASDGPSILWLAQAL